MSNSESEDLKDLLPPEVAGRVQSLRRNGDRIMLVVQAEGLDAGGRAALERSVQTALRTAPGVGEVHVAMMADKPTAAPARRIIAVGSGKGGVGKSTVAANLAVALARGGRRVGMVDADIYGPSQARLLGTEGRRATAREEKLVPLDGACGVPVLSMAHLSLPGQAIAWRGPMASGALTQLLDAHWDGVDVLIVDLPPGTGDIQLTMLQKFKPSGAVIVSTPQDLALIDATRAMELFDKGGVPVIGLIENMAGYQCPHCGEISDPFGSGGAEAVARQRGIDFLGRIPLDIAIRQDSDAGTPPAAGDGEEARVFARLAGRLAEWLDAARAPA